MSFTTNIRSFFAGIGDVVSILAGEANNGFESRQRPQLEGSDLFGDYNFRTERPDCGIDAAGWYENDD